MCCITVKVLIGKMLDENIIEFFCQHCNFITSFPLSEAFDRSAAVKKHWDKKEEFLKTKRLHVANGKLLCDIVLSVGRNFLLYDLSIKIF